MIYDFEEVRARPNTAKWGLARQMGAIGMGVADMDFKLMPEVIKAIEECAELGEFGYGGMQGSDYKAVTDWLAYRGEIVPREHIVPTPGVLYSARAAMYMLTEPGDKVIVQTPLHTPSIATAAMQSLSYLASASFIKKHGSGFKLLIFSHLAMGALSAVLLPFFLPVKFFTGGTFSAILLAVWIVTFVLGQGGFFFSQKYIESSRLASLLGLKIIVLAIASLNK